MQLQQLVLRDFQAHAHRKVSFGPGITTIMGPTDTGKSAILRALRWVCLNDFAGDDFVRQGAKRAEVKLTGVHGDKTFEITRAKGISTNVYYLDEREFRAFGNGVPQDIEKLLALSPLNFQDQHDPPFWFNETAGEVSRRLNAIVDLSLMDEALGYVGGQIRRAQEERAWQEEKVQSVKRSLETFADLDQRMEDFKRLQDCLAQWQRLSARRGRLEQLTSEADRITNLGMPYKRKAKEGMALCQQIEAWQQINARLNRLRSLVEELQKRQAEWSTSPPRLDTLERCYQQWRTAAERQERLWNLQAKLMLAKDTLEKSRQRLKAAEEAFHAVRGQPCPVCGQPLP